ncbi:hypothetical protein C7T35_01245 [Variovorax sp. WS11]|uniref:hypothetical protein n=1 Tax=Variovorax sp. WS11 TaxID=1105204 RepID=UPI000D0DBB17|nr:hypothetical protein [Variovorax sp. WS11]NDZ11523.1 hypothetical protein [Variovorax sp. WS11]PSL86622.1 hypothetical protein C7T35_01245 [Variovorax sp. WS11]
MIFAPLSPEKVVAQQLYEARRLALEHRAAAEHHAALADMYDGRVERLEPLSPPLSKGKP